MERLDAAYFGNLFVDVAKRPTSRVSYHVNPLNRFEIRVTGNGNIPYDTGRTQDSIFLSYRSPTTAVVRFNGETSPYAVYLQYCVNVGRSNVPNSHRNFLQKFANGEFAAELRRRFGEVQIE